MGSSSAPSDGHPTRLRAGVVGLGMMGRNHVRVYDEVLTDVDLVAVADPDPRRCGERRPGGRPVVTPTRRRCSPKSSSTW